MATAAARAQRARVDVLGALAALGGAIFLLSSAANSRTEEGNASFLGLEEGDWRALLNPVLAVWIAWAWRARRRAGAAGAVGSWLLVVGLATVLVGNVLEFGLLGEPFLPESPVGSGSWSWGWLPVLLGAPVAFAGAGILAVSSARRRLSR